jgi:hypothetical protein
VTLSGSDLELFERSLSHALASDDVDAALDAMGWPEALADDRRLAVSLLFELQGRAAAASSAIHTVMGGTYLSAGTGGIDPDLGLRPGTEPVPDDALAAGRLALAHELVGASRAMLELARVHALERVQFDRPIAQFQAVRHKLAETLVAIEGANDACNAAWELGVDPMAAAAAKALAGRAARLAAKHCQQVLAGIGFTLEHPFHRFLRRALVVDRLLGDSKTLTRELGLQLLSARQVPPMLQL